MISFPLREFRRVRLNFNVLLPLVPLHQVLKRVHDVLEAVHVIAVDVPVPEVPVRVVLDLAQLLGHDVPRRRRVDHDAFFQERDLQFAQNGLEHELGLVKLLEEVAVVEQLIEDDLFEADGKLLQLAKHSHQSRVDLQNKE